MLRRPDNVEPITGRARGATTRPSGTSANRQTGAGVIVAACGPVTRRGPLEARSDRGRVRGRQPLRRLPGDRAPLGLAARRPIAVARGGLLGRPRDRTLGAGWTGPPGTGELVDEREPARVLVGRHAQRPPLGRVELDPPKGPPAPEPRDRVRSLHGGRMRDMPGTGSLEREQAGDRRAGVAQRGRGLGPVAVTRRCGTQSSTWTKPSNVAPSRTQASCSERR
jgi:hypothetical protein